MKTSLIFMAIAAICITSIDAKSHKVKSHVKTHTAGHSKEKRPKHTTSAEEIKRPEKPDRARDRKRDRYGAFINPPKGKI